MCMGLPPEVYVNQDTSFVKCACAVLITLQPDNRKPSFKATSPSTGTVYSTFQIPDSQ